MVLRLLGQLSIGPSGVLDQSIERMSLPISPPPVSQSAARAPSSTVGSAEVGSFISLQLRPPDRPSVPRRLAMGGTKLERLRTVREPLLKQR
jgi:hypothetical protein